MKALEYYIGAVEAIIELLTESEISIEPEKGFVFFIVGDKNHFQLKMSWIRGYQPADFQGDHDNPADPDVPVYDSQAIYFNYDVKMRKIIKDIRAELEVIEDAELKMFEKSDLTDNSDDLYEKRREAVG